MNIDTIFSTSDIASNAVHRAHYRRVKLNQIQSVESLTCGNCQRWMTSECKPEKKLGQFKSSESTACQDFERRSRSMELSKQFHEELAALSKP